MLNRQKSFREGRSLWLLLAAVAILPLSCARVRRDAGREVWAKVDGVPIYRDQVEALYRRRMAILPGRGKPEQALSFKLSLLNELIDNQILLDRAAHAEVTISDPEVDERLAQIRSPYSGPDFNAELRKQGLTPAELRQQVRDNLIIRKLVQQEIDSRVTVTQQEIAAYYAHNKANFTVPQTEYHLAQILVTPVSDPQIQNLMNDDARNEKEAERKIHSLYAQLRSGEAFAKIAEEYSEDPRTAQGGGDMGFIPASSLATDPLLQRAVSQLKPGQFTGILRDQAGFRIVKLLGRVEAGEHPLSDPQVENSIRKTLTDEKEELLKAAYVEKLRDAAHVVNYLALEIVQNGGDAASFQKPKLN